MPAVQPQPQIARNAPIATWFRVGGGADQLCCPASADDIAACVRTGQSIRVLGDGANLLVADDGIDGLVLDLRDMHAVETDPKTGLVRAEAGARLPQLINRCAREGLGGLEVLAGIPASIGGAVVMNAGGRFGAIADTIAAVEAVDPATGESVRLTRGEIGFDYRRSGLSHLIITAAEFALTPGDPARLRESLKSCMAYKRDSQPLSDHSAGCCFKNPNLPHDLPGIGPAGERVSAGLLLDRAGCKGLRAGAATVSDRHANFFVTAPGATAADLIALMVRTAQRVRDEFGVELEREVIVWERSR